MLKINVLQGISALPVSIIKIQFLPFYLSLCWFLPFCSGQLVDWTDLPDDDHQCTMFVLVTIQQTGHTSIT